MDGDWYVSDATNGHDYKAADLSSYENSLIPKRMDFVVLEDDKCEYTYENRYLNVKSIKPTTRTDLTSFPQVFVVLHSDRLRDWIRTW